MAGRDAEGHLEGAMIRAGFTTTDPASGTRMVVIESDAETNGNGWTIEVYCPPHAPPHVLEHLHLSWTETFEILSGIAIRVTDLADATKLVDFLKSDDFKKLRKACSWSNYQIDWRLFTYLKEGFWR